MTQQQTSIHGILQNIRRKKYMKKKKKKKRKKNEKELL